MRARREPTRDEEDPAAGSASKSRVVASPDVRTSLEVRLALPSGARSVFGELPPSVAAATGVSGGDAAAVARFEHARVACSLFEDDNVVYERFAAAAAALGRPAPSPEALLALAGPWVLREAPPLEEAHDALARCAARAATALEALHVPRVALRLRAFLGARAFCALLEAVPSVAGRYGGARAVVAASVFETAEQEAEAVGKEQREEASGSKTSFSVTAAVVQLLQGAGVAEDDARSHLRMLGLPTDGDKAALVERLTLFLQGQQEQEEEGKDKKEEGEQERLEPPQTLAEVTGGRPRGWLYAWLREHVSRTETSLAPRARVFRMAWEHVTACALSVDTADVVASLDAYGERLRVLFVLRRHTEFLFEDLVGPFLSPADLARASRALPELARHELKLRTLAQYRRRQREAQLKKFLVDGGWSAAEAEAYFAPAPRFRKRYERFLRFDRGFLTPAREARELLAWKKKPRKQLQRELKKLLKERYGREPRSDSQLVKAYLAKLCNQYIAKRECLPVEEVASICHITGRQFERGGHVTFSNNHYQRERELIAYRYRDGLSWQAAAAKAEANIVVYSSRPSYGGGRRWYDDSDDDYDDDWY